MDIKELELEEAPKEKEFYLIVRYYRGATPFVSVSDKIDDFASSGDAIYKVKIPFKDLNTKKG